MDSKTSLALGIEQFNQQNFYGCHDTLEAVWLEAPPAEKNFYQGILQIAVAHYHLSNQNWQGAVILLGEGIRRLKAFRPVHQGIETENLLQSSAALLAELQTIAPEGLAQWLRGVEPEKLAPKIQNQGK